MRSIKTLLAALILAAFALNAQASPGGLDKFGGHTDHKTGQYHFHQLNGKKLAEPLPGEDPNKNGGKIVYTGTPKYSDEAASEKKAPAAKMEKAEKKEEKAEKPKKEKKAKKAKAEVKEEKADKKAPAGAPAPQDDKTAKKPKKAKKTKKEKAADK